MSAAESLRHHAAADAEFTGQARALRDRMAAASTRSSPHMVAIYRDAAAILQRRKRQHAAFRPDHLLEFERRWMAIPAEERLHLDVERTKTSLVITEVRVSSLVLTNTAWADGQKDRRGFSNEHAAIMGDLAALAQINLPDAPTPNFVVTAPSEGEWRGSVTRFTDMEKKENLVFAARTFV